MEDRKYDLEDRLVEYGCRMIDVVEALQATRAGTYIAGQLIKSCLSPAFNYGEVQAAESRNDFIHKLGIVLKELKECRAGLEIIRRKEMIKPLDELIKYLTRRNSLSLLLQKVLKLRPTTKRVGCPSEHGPFSMFNVNLSIFDITS